MKQITSLVVLLSLSLALPLALAHVAAANDDPLISTFTLDELSFVSFGGDFDVSLKAGSTIEFEFSKPGRDGVVAFEIDPSGLMLEPVDLPGPTARLRYKLVKKASGKMYPTPGGRRLEFDAVVSAVIDGANESLALTYEMPFSTETASVMDQSGKKLVERQGARVDERVLYAQIVGTAVNSSVAYPNPGAAIYTVLSGRFDHLPGISPEVHSSSPRP